MKEDLFLEQIEDEKMEEMISKSKPKTKEETCKVLWVKKNKFAVSFKGFGITLDGKIDSSIKEVKIQYEGDIGKSNFKIIKFK